MFKLGKTVLKIPTSDWDTRHQCGLTFWRDTMLNIKAWAKVLCSKKATGKLLMQTLCWLTAKHTRCLFILVCATKCIWQMVRVCVRVWYVQWKPFCCRSSFSSELTRLWPVGPYTYIICLPGFTVLVRHASVCSFWHLCLFYLTLFVGFLEMSKAWLSAL